MTLAPVRRDPWTSAHRDPWLPVPKPGAAKPHLDPWMAEARGAEVFTTATLPVYNKKPQSTVVLLMGRRGAGKTLTMTARLRMMLDLYQHYHVPFHLMSNYFVKFFRPPENGHHVDVYDPMLSAAFQNYPAWMANGFMALDEIQGTAYGRNSISVSNKSTAQFLTQIRKRHVELICTTQFPQVLDYQVLLQVDLFVECEIIWSHQTPAAVRLYIHDYWGQWTGLNYRKRWPPTKDVADRVTRLVNIHKVFGQYDTDQIQITSTMPESVKARIAAEYADDRFAIDAMGGAMEQAGRALGDASVDEYRTALPAAPYDPEPLDDFIRSLGPRTYLSDIRSVISALSPQGAIVTLDDVKDLLVDRGFKVGRERGTGKGLVAQR